jgi:hypothetical protein
MHWDKQIGKEGEGKRKNKGRKIRKAKTWMPLLTNSKLALRG